MADPQARTFVYADMMYDGVSRHGQPHALIGVAEGRIVTVHGDVPQNDVPSNALRVPIVMPGFLDLQINGAGDVQFNFDLTISGLETMVAASALGGATHIFPTFTTAPNSDYRRAIEVVAEAVAIGVPGIAGLHLEGPFISRHRPGIHQKDFIRPLRQSDVDLLCEAAAKIPLLVTLAPEEQPPHMLQQLQQAGVTLFAGHTEATFEDMTRAAQSGVTGGTHLFNAMSQMTPREPGAVGAVLGGGAFYAGIVADGHHVHPHNLNLAVRALPDHLCLVTDAMQTMNGRSQEMTLYGRRIRLKHGRLTGDDGTLGGAHLTMANAVQTLVQHTVASLGDAAKFASANPAQAVGLQHIYGQLKPGLSASMSLLSTELDCLGILRDGRCHLFGQSVPKGFARGQSADLSPLAGCSKASHHATESG
ncbi:N-acetylglucosamine-6-phosphate deacetylase [uncultured Shimia sp.]|uniref:N-acetylglucosamine-6-phosphate deacetylase n=1 Tax=uncultured Shimia sp. TaxID=573152 RepID=UPI00261AE5DF|nr:N-acetylglucosamine-6-phosphate deacetylase [uncultured Shimia sp.]